MPNSVIVGIELSMHTEDSLEQFRLAAQLFRTTLNRTELL
jgi:hypothetical protein